MKRTGKVLSLIFALMLMLTIGCLAIWAAVFPDTITVAVGETKMINNENFTNTFGREVTFTKADDGNYYLGIVTIKTEDVETDYNGEEQSAATLYQTGANYDATTITVINEVSNLADFGLSVKVDTSVGGLYKDAGTYENKVEVMLVDSNGVTPDYAKWFKVGYDYGDFVINQLPVTVTTNSAEKIYDGEALTGSSFTTSGTVVKNDTVITNVSYSSITYIYADNKVVSGDTWYGEVENSITYTPNPNYNVTVVAGSLKMYPVTGLTFEMIGEDATKVYDGTPLKYNGSIKIPGSTQAKIIGGDSFVTPSITDLNAQNVNWPVNVTATPVKVADLGLTMSFRNSAGEAIECYQYTLTGEPELSITKAPITVTVKDMTITYGDNAPVYGIDVTVGQLFGTDELDLVYTCPYQFHDNAGTYEINAKAVESDATNGLNSNYEITINKGNLTVGKKTITVKPKDNYSVEYGDAALANDSFEMHPDTIAEIVVFNGVRDTLPVHFECEYKQFDAVGSSYVIKTFLDNEDPNYEIIVEHGTLTVERRTLTIFITDQVLVWRDDPLSGDEYATYTYDGYLAVDEEKSKLADLLTVSAICNYVKNNDAGMYNIVGSFVDNSDGSITDNYTIKIVDGTLTVKGYLLSQIVWEKNPSFVFDYTPHAPAAKGYDDVTGEWIELTTTSETYVGEHLAYVTGTTNPNYRVNQLTAGVAPYSITEAAPVVFTAANVTIGGDYTINFKIDMIAIDQYGANFEVVMKRAGFNDVVINSLANVKIEKDANGNSAYYVFSYSNIAPQSMGVGIDATFTTGGQSDTITYSIKEYCYNLLNASYNTEDTELKNVLVAMLRYGAASQITYGGVAAGSSELVTNGLEALGYGDAFVTARDEYLVADASGDVTAEGWKLGYGVYMNNGASIYVNVTTPENADLTGLVLKIVAQDGTVLESGKKLDEISGKQFYEINFTDCTNVYTVIVENADNEVIASRSIGVETYAGLSDMDVVETLVDFSYALQEYCR